MIVMAVRVAVFAAAGFAALSLVLWLCKTQLSDTEKARIAMHPESLLKNHKALTVMAYLAAILRVVAIGALVVAAVMWAVGL
jgi:hypothetical protein